MPLLFDSDRPDPFVGCFNGRFYLYSTETDHIHLPLLVSDDMQYWDALPDAMPLLPEWVEPGQNWAACVIEAPGGGYLAYFSARIREARMHGIGIAWAERPEGPFVDVLGHPLVEAAIDPEVFRAPDGSLWFYAAGVGHTGGVIWGQRLMPDGLGLVGERVPLVWADRPCEHGVVEAPTMVYRGGCFVMLYSSARFETPHYAIRYAIGGGPLGPFVKPINNLLLGSYPGVDAPGHQAVIRCGDRDVLVYHGWYEGKIGYDAGHYRAVFSSPLWWDGPHPYVELERVPDLTYKIALTEQGDWHKCPNCGSVGAWGAECAPGKEYITRYVCLACQRFSYDAYEVVRQAFADAEFRWWEANFVDALQKGWDHLHDLAEQLGLWRQAGQLEAWAEKSMPDTSNSTAA